MAVRASTSTISRSASIIGSSIRPRTDFSLFLSIIYVKNEVENVLAPRMLRRNCRLRFGSATSPSCCETTRNVAWHRCTRYAPVPSDSKGNWERATLRNVAKRCATNSCSRCVSTLKGLCICHPTLRRDYCLNT